ncbi:uncharacterized protein LOC110018364 [Phalaenopsis equestris]|uniref:uncharacterized protein LOC110018364 n=1 Tax=Phalaenopsis equestris TaxID=78828 RepID=UPI0009E41660|nr:uncharacterized protein LOC110018364 [Phalaenopsis equestris]
MEYDSKDWQFVYDVEGDAGSYPARENEEELKLEVCMDILARAKVVIPRKQRTYYSKQWSTMRKKLMKYIVPNFVCGKAGFKKELEITKTVKYKRAETTTGCPAMIRYEVDKEGNWGVKKLIESHNHSLANPGDKHLLHSSRKISEVNADVLRSMTQSGIRPKDTFNFLAQEVGGVENLECTKADAFNFIQREKRSRIENGDANALL